METHTVSAELEPKLKIYKVDFDWGSKPVGMNRVHFLKVKSPKSGRWVEVYMGWMPDREIFDRAQDASQSGARKLELTWLDLREIWTAFRLYSGIC